MIKNPKKISEDVRPPLSKTIQSAVLLTFRKTVLTGKTPDSTPWKPRRVMEELWDLWDDKPIGIGEKQRFLDKYYQPVFRYQSGAVLSFRQHGILFYLIEKFNSKHADSKDTVIPFSIINRLSNSANSFIDLVKDANENRIEDYCLVKDPKIINPDTLVSENIGILYFIASVENVDCFSYNFHVAYKVNPKSNDEVDQIWPLVFYFEDLSYLEVGYYLPRYSISVSKSIAWDGVHEMIHSPINIVRIMDFYKDKTGSLCVRQKNTGDSPIDDTDQSDFILCSFFGEYIADINNSRNAISMLKMFDLLEGFEI